MTAFGGGLSDPSTAVAEEKAARLGVQAWRLAAHARSLQLVDTQVEIDFRVADQGDPYAQAARLASLLDRLVGRELPALTRAIRCEARVIRRQSPTPSGGRIDAARTWLTRRQTRGRDFSLRTVRRIAETPVNQVVATRLRTVEAILRRLRGLTLLDVEQRAVDEARQALRRFMSVSPLASVSALDAAALPRVIRDAQRRPAEWRKVAGFHRWFNDFHAIEVARLRLLDSAEAITRGPAFELAVAAGALIALAQGLDARRWRAAGLQISSSTFSDNRRFTVRLAQDDREAHLQARDLALPAARDLASMLHPRCVLVTPGPTRVEPPFCVPVAELVNAEVFTPILDALFARLAATA